MLVERGPAPEILGRNINPYILQFGFRNDRLWQGVAELQVLQTDISDILQVAGLRCRLQGSIIAGITGQISIRIVFCTIIALMLSRHVVIRAVILSPENTFRTGIPILFTHPLEEGGKEEVVPVTGKVDAIRIARQRISDHGLVTVVVHGIIAVVDHMVTVQVLDLHISRIGDALG